MSVTSRGILSFRDIKKKEAEVEKERERDLYVRIAASADVCHMGAVKRVLRVADLTRVVPLVVAAPLHVCVCV
jgi:hypothetical protein